MLPRANPIWIIGTKIGVEPNFEKYQPVWHGRFISKFHLEAIWKRFRNVQIFGHLDIWTIKAIMTDLTFQWP